ncbi:HNH endonuclease [Pontibacter vulgaris]|uniref:HNH endonuclease n=1 Tax=Pontibacter vulgaris TaxID=2905679 RepID=UPI001FA6CFF2|nr:NUMOD4 domain-containing protein [Pontibacter vulgaris]
MKETFKNIKGYGGQFAVSNFGNVRDNITCQLKKQTRRKSGYFVVTLNSKQEYVHRLVLKTLKPTNDSSLIVDHIDSRKENNTLENLQYLTRSENVKKAAREGRHLRGSNQPNSKLIESEVLFIRNAYSKGVKSSELVKLFRVSKPTIWRIVNWKNWTHL